MATITGLEFGVLGPLRLSVQGTPVPLGTPKQRAVLAMLVINRNRRVAIESLVGAVWDESPPAGARATLHTYVSNLRRVIGGAGLDPLSALANAPPGYQLTVADTDCDLGRFVIDKTAGVHAAAARRFEEASSHLSAALAQWRGPVLEDLRHFGFVEAFAAPLVAERLVAHTARAEAEIACGRADSVISELEALTADHPYREPLWVQLITAYYFAERQSDALAAYGRVKTTLADDLGIDPGPTLRALHAKILRQEPVDVERAAQASADLATTLARERPPTAPARPACLRETSGRRHRLHASITRIGRLPDNDIVLDDTVISRHHAVIIETGSGFVINDLRSANGVEVQHLRIEAGVPLADGDHIRIGDREFTFELGPVADPKQSS